MKVKFTFLVSVVAFFTLFLVSCTQDNADTIVKSYTPEELSVISNSLDLPSGTFEYKNPELPAHFTSGGFLGSSVTNHGATLGRVLFYDTRLSANETKSCASCHNQNTGFADARALSEGFEGGDTKRNTLALGNVRFYYQDRGFFWDERASSVEEQVRQTVSNHIEMGMDLDLLPNKFEGIDYYEILFEKAYGTKLITTDRITNALSQFVRSVISSNSTFDQAMIADNKTWDVEGDLSKYTAQENLGKQLYFANCSSCHGNIVFLGRSSANNGLDLEYTDNGIGDLTGQASKNGLFKVPFLRNIEVTGPYMHDGRFETLEEVIDHYSNGIQAHENLAPQLKTPEGTPMKMNFSEEEKAALIAFLYTLTDESLSSDEKYADPFK
ncbi:MAG: c-type cytochrome [Bacteroidetes bacterium]|jgi:cytochrome c peroxidase|nr:c-type cytochrome [Bacteroidota bacterium]MDF1864152.1 cytochrome c peroxidase [Saprospiraceae bacterium]